MSHPIHTIDLSILPPSHCPAVASIRKWPTQCLNRMCLLTLRRSAFPHLTLAGRSVSMSCSSRGQSRRVGPCCRSHFSLLLPLTNHYKTQKEGHQRFRREPEVFPGRHLHARIPAASRWCFRATANAERSDASHTAQQVRQQSAH